MGHGHITIVKCSNCNKNFEKRTGEYNRCKRSDWNHFCSRKCYGEFHKERLTKHGKENYKKFLKTYKRQKDELSHFRWHLHGVRQRAKDKNYKCCITLEYLKDIWEKQNGTCPYTGWKLNPVYFSSKGVDKYSASLDRIDSSKGYIEGNVQFVSVMANYAKHTWNEQDFIDFCVAVARNKQCQ